MFTSRCPHLGLLIFGVRSLCAGGLLCIERCGAAPLAFTHQMLAALPIPKCVQTFPSDLGVRIDPRGRTSDASGPVFPLPQPTPPFSASFIDLNPTSKEKCSCFSTMPGLKISTNSEKDIHEGWQTIDLKPNPACFLCVCK